MFYEQLYRRGKHISLVGVRVSLKCRQMPTPVHREELAVTYIFFSI